MNSVITIDLKEFDHIKDKSTYNNNYYRMKPEYLLDKNQHCEILERCYEDHNTSEFYAVDEKGNTTFLFCDYPTSDDDVYSGILFNRWI